MQADPMTPEPAHPAGAETEPASFALERFLPYRLSVLANTVSEGIARGYRGRHGINVTEWRIVAVLGRFPGLSAREVAERTAMDKVAISRGVKSLMAKGLLTRRTDPGDRRRQHLELTPAKGRELLGAVIPLARDFERRLLETLTPDERCALSAALARLQQRADQLLRD
jgi:DNA-binding MarR family transcriptional regulator